MFVRVEMGRFYSFVDEPLNLGGELGFDGGPDFACYEGRECEFA